MLDSANVHSSKPSHLSQTVAYSVAIGTLGLTTSSIGPVLPTLAEQTKVSLSTVAFLFTARSLGFMLGTFQGGKLLDSFSGHRMTAMAICVMSLMMFATPLSSVFLLLVLVMFFLGTAEGALDVSCNTLLVWTHGEKVSPYLNGVHFFFGVGAFLSPMVIAWLSSFGHKSAFWLLALLIAPCVLFFLWLPTPQRREETKETAENKSDPRIVFLVALVFFLYVGMEVGFSGWIYTYAVKLKLSSETNAAYLTSVFWGALTVGRLFSIPLTRKFKLEKLLLADLFAGCLSLMLIFLLSDSREAVWIGTICLGLSMASFFPTLFSFAERVTVVSGKTAGRLLLGASSGAMTLPWVIGQAFERISPQAAMLVIALIVFAALLVFILLIRVSKTSVGKKSSYAHESLIETQT